MNKILFLLFLFSFIEPEISELCTKILDTYDINECLSAQTSDEGKKCCFCEGDVEKVFQQYCYEFPKEMTSQESLQDYYMKETKFTKEDLVNFKIKCEDGDTNTPNNPSYLKIGLLFILGLLF